MEEEGNNGDDTACVNYLTRADDILATDCLRGNLVCNLIQSYCVVLIICGLLLSLYFILYFDP